LPVAAQGEEAEEAEEAVSEPVRPSYPPVPPKAVEKKDYSVLVFAVIGIVLLGAVIGYGVIKLRKSGSGDEGEIKKEKPEAGHKKGGAEEGDETGTAPEKKDEQDGAGEGEKAKQPESHIIVTSKVSASSFHKKYPPENVIDGDPATVWQEEKTNKPVGEWLKLGFEHEVTITRIGFASGFDYIDQEGKDYYPLNCRLKTAEAIFSTGETVKINLEDTRSLQFINIDPPRKTSWIRLTVYDVYKGSWFFDNAIGEIEVWGYEDETEQAQE
jgi:hypothetical protein